MSVPTSYSLPRLIVVMVECVLYGAYVVIFGLAIRILPRKFDVPSVKKFLFPIIIALFILATINIAYDLVGEAYAILYTIPYTNEKMWMVAGQYIDEITFVISDVLGDIILLHRVYAVWGFRKKILYPLLLIVLVAKGPTSYVLPRLIVVMAECALYGVYAVMFGLAIWILPRKFNVPSVKKIFFPIIIALFILATINTAYDLVGEGYAILYTIPLSNEKTWMIAGQSIDELTFFISDVLGDIVLFHRVYAVWGSQKKILLPLCLIVGVAKVLNIVEAVGLLWRWSDPNTSNQFPRIGPKILFIFADVNATANMLMTLLIAGRIWWISRALQAEYASALIPGPQRHWYYKTIAIIIESGVIYPIYLILAALVLPNSTCLGVITVGLAPTLIAVRVGLGSTYDNQSLSTMGPSVILFSPHAESQRSTNHVLDESLISPRIMAEDANTILVKDDHEKLTEVV
ncbi:hypothetical protein GYMLUDRAFT_259189 [Collybiopsis luxurians FD-317 M1]|uniref:Uncharacterized protein n=1 Tax=Collybiopsis luxurians FD-317 M1 TaxID=944289 RepID=A0A0D0CWG4_9AGAR|nr:hypothetical protein GYMLUDRAFT_259189 [Collybiopsis luxurians FD-317 M1]